MKKLLLLSLALFVACGDGGSTGPSPDPVSVATTSLPDGTVGTSYSVVLAASGGTGAYGWSLAGGSLPAGLTLSANGAISGTPGAPGASSFTVQATSGSQKATRALSINVQAPEVTITTGSLPDGSVGAVYSQNLAASGGAGTGTYTWSVQNGSLPAGLTLSAAGLLSGTPTAGGTSAFTVQVTSGSRTATKSFSITVAFPAVSVTTSSLADGTVGTAYNQSLAASGGSGTYNWALTSGTLPAGLTLYASGAITGTPTAAGKSDFSVQATSGTLSAARALSITVVQPAVTITRTSLRDGEVGVAYSDTLTATGGLGSYTWSIASQSPPPGLTLSSAGILSGTPTTHGTFTFSVRATSGGQDTKQFTVTVQPPPVTITSSATLKAAIQGIAYADTLKASGGTGSYTWERTTGSLPAGLSLSSGGVVTGTPTAQGSSTFTVQVTSGARTATKDVAITVQPPNVTITTTTLPGGAVGDPYSATLAATGGSGTYTWERTAGALPGGLALNANTGEISGTPQFTGTFNFTVKATSGTQSDTKSLSIVISAAIPAVTITTTSLPGGNVGEVYSGTLAASGGDGTFTWTRVGGDELPAGLTLNTSGLISGTPTTQGTSTFTVQATSAGKSATKQLSITIGAALPDVTITNASPLAGGTVGAGYGPVQLAATGGTGSFTWSRVSGDQLPPGLALSSSGQIDGTPTATDTATFMVRAQSGSKYADKQFTIAVVAGPVNITTTTLSDATYNVLYSRTLAATGGAGAGTYTWSVSAGTLPSWATLTAGGVLSGRPTSEGSHTFTVRAASGGFTDDQPLTLDVVLPNVTVTTLSLPNGVQDAAYPAQALTASGGNGTYTWSYTGTLPTGLTLSPAGALTGTPTAAGTYNFTVQASSGAAPFTKVGTKAFSITIAPVGGYAMYLDVGNAASGQSVSRGNQIAIPITLDLTQQDGKNLASITVRIDWDNTKFDWVSGPPGNWVDAFDFPASYTPSYGTAAQGYVMLTAYVTEPKATLTNFTLFTVNLAAKAGAATGTTPVTATINTSLDANAQPVTVTPRNLTVTVQ